MPISVRDALQSSGQLSSWLGNPNPAYERMNTVTPPKTDTVGNIVKGAGNVLGAAGSILAHTVTDPINAGVNLVKGTMRNMGLDSRANALEAQRKSLDAKDAANLRLVKSGKMSKDDYNKASHDLIKQYQAISAGAEGVNNDYYGAGQVAKDYTKLATGVVTAVAPVLKPVAAGAALSDATTIAATRAAQAASATAKGAKAAEAAAAANPVNALQAVPAALGVKAANGINTAVGAGTGVAMSVPGVLAAGGKVLARNAINQQTAQAAGDIPGQVANGDIKGAATNAMLLGAPAAIGAVAKILPKVGKTVADAMYGRQGFFDAVKSAGGPDMLAHLDSVSGAAQKRTENLLRQVQQYNLDQFNGDAKAAGAHFVQYLRDNGRDLSKLDGNALNKELGTWVKANMNINKAYNDGRLFASADGTKIALKPGQRLIAARFDQQVYGPLVQQLKSAGNASERQAIIDSQIKAGADWTKNPNLLSTVQSIASKDSGWDKELSKVQRMRSLFMAPPKEMSAAEKAVFKGGDKYNIPAGYFPAISSSARADFSAVKDTAALDRGKAPNAILGVAGKALEKAGISTQSQSPTTAVKFKANFAGEIKQIPGLNKTPAEISKALSDAAEHTKGISDERQFSVERIKAAIPGVTHDQAKAIKAAYKTAYNKLSISELGIAGKVENKLYNIPGYGTYRRIQGIGRYELNPFFRAQERTETEVVSQVMGKGKALEAPGVQMVDRIFGRGAKQDAIDSTINAMKERNIFADAGFGSHGANNAGFSQISAKLSRGQQRSIGGLVNTLAERSGKPVNEFLDNMDAKILDNIRSIVQYPRQGFTSSSFAKTLNLLVFPSRYNIKLAGMLGKALANSPAATQIATLKAVSDLSTFMHSDAGKKWQSDNSEVLGIINYLSPFNNLAGVFKALGGDKVTVGDFGAVGGLPLGFVSQVLQDTGVVPKTDAPYLNPKTGEVVPDKVPQNTAGAVKVALTDLVNSMYSFPGRTFGISTSKNSLTQSLPGLKLQKGETKDVARTDLTPQQKDTQALLRAGSKKATPAPVAPSPSRSLNVPRMPLPKLAPKAPKKKIFARAPRQL